MYSRFCDRQRQLKENSINFRLDANSIKVTPNSFNAKLETINEPPLELKITYYPFLTFRVHINETSEVYKRYSVPPGDVVLENIEPQPIVVNVANDKAVLLGSNSHKAVVYYDPFSIEFYLNDHHVLSLNKRGLLHFEYQRVKIVDPENIVVAENTSSQELPISNEMDNPPTEDVKNEKEDTVPNPPEQPNWHEYFKNHLDTRPDGLNSISLDINFHGINHVYGIPEHADQFSLKSTTQTDPYRLFNLDVFQYETYNPMALYGSVPYMWGQSINYSVGVFWPNPSEAWIDVEHKSSSSNKVLFGIPNFFSKSSEIDSVNTRWMFETGLVDLYVMIGREPSEVSKAYAHLTGTTKLPPMFSLAYHQCRWNYNDEEDVLSLDDNFDKYLIPVDVIWLDIEHTDGKRYFTWDSNKFPNPGAMVDRLNEKARKLVTVVDPHIKRDSNWPLYTNAQSQNIFVKDRDGKDYDGWCWPGSSSWPDFVSPEVRRWWAQLYLTYNPVRKDSMFSWNDMGEPSVFSGPEVTIHKDARHLNGEENRNLHNLYGLYVHQASWEGQLLRSNNEERPFVLTRAFFAGSQRTSAVWTGDNDASWSHLKISVPMLLSLSITGITFSGADVGGFFGNPDPELLTRWYQAAAYQPFMRAHAHLDTARREPWLFPEEYVKLIRASIHARYQLLSYWYTTFARSELDGQPVMAPLWYHFPKDVNTYGIDNEYMIGDALLVHPIVDQGVREAKIYFPEGVWYYLSNFEYFKGNQLISFPVSMSTIPVFYRGGTIIPRKERIRRSSWLMRNDPYTIIISVDPDKNASIGYIYFDDFHSVTPANTYLYKMVFDVSLGRLNLTRISSSNEKQTSKEETLPKIERVVLIGLGSAIQRVVVNDHQTGIRRNLEFTTSPAGKSDSKQFPQIVVIRQPNLFVNDHWDMYVVTSQTVKEDL